MIPSAFKLCQPKEIIKPIENCKKNSLAELFCPVKQASWWLGKWRAGNVRPEQELLGILCVQNRPVHSSNQNVSYHWMSLKVWMVQSVLPADSSIWKEDGSTLEGQCNSCCFELFPLLKSLCMWKARRSGKLDDKLLPWHANFPCAHLLTPPSPFMHFPRWYCPPSRYPSYMHHRESVADQTKHLI